MTAQVFLASTAFGVATIVAAMADGAFEDAGRRVLVLSNNAAFPETANEVWDIAGLTALMDRFDAVYSYNEAIAPQHPSDWHPRAADRPMLDRTFRALWGLGDEEIRLVVESIQVDPALALGDIFADAAIDVYADGLMSYGPTRNKLPAALGARVERLLHLDLVPGLVPVLLSEWQVQPVLISAGAFRGVVDAIRATARDGGARGAYDAEAGSVAVVVGQYLSAAEILTIAEERELHLELIRGAVAAGFLRIVFKPHPTAPGSSVAPLLAAAESLGARLEVRATPELLETWFDDPAIGLVLGCFSTALMTAAAFYALPVARAGTELLLEKLSPFENSNRVPVTLVDVLAPAVHDLVGTTPPGPPSAEEIGERVVPLVRAVSYTMQAERYPGLRAGAEEFLAANYEGNRKYFRRKRLTVLDLPGRLPARPGRRLLAGGLPSGVRRRAREALGPDFGPLVARTGRKAVRTGRRVAKKGRMIAKSALKRG